MGEIELVEIEQRMGEYPAQARNDIMLLTRELRRLYEAENRRKAAQAASPLYDPLTGLLNAGAYGVRFAMARARATRYRKIFAVMSVDLQFPGAPGEQVAVERAIKGVAERLEGCVRATDTLARIGDQNFAIILEDLSQAGHAERVKQTVQDVLAEPMRVGMTDLVPSASVNLQFYPSPQGDSPVH